MGLVNEVSLLPATIICTFGCGSHNHYRWEATGREIPDDVTAVVVVSVDQCRRRHRPELAPLHMGPWIMNTGLYLGVLVKTPIETNIL